MSGPFQKILTGVGFFLSTCLLAVTGYVIAGWELMDAIYMVIITIFGVGYGEVQPIESTPMRVFTIGVIVAGYAAAIYTFGGFVQMLTEGELNRALGARRMTSGIERLKEHTIVCGFGRIGRILCAELAAHKSPFVVVDNNPEAIKDAEAERYLVVSGNATEEETLERAGVDRAATLATVLREDAMNVFITLTARDLSPDVNIVARGENPATEKKLLRSGANKVILPAAIGALRMAHMITHRTAESFLEGLQAEVGLNDELLKIGLQLDELEIGKDSPLLGKKIADIEVKGNHGFLIVALRRADGTTMVNPDGTSPLGEDDTVVVLGHHDDIPQLMQRYELKREITYRGVTMPAS